MKLNVHSSIGLKSYPGCLWQLLFYCCHPRRLFQFVAVCPSQSRTIVCSERNYQFYFFVDWNWCLALKLVRQHFCKMFFLSHYKELTLSSETALLLEAHPDLLLSELYVMNRPIWKLQSRCDLKIQQMDVISTVSKSAKKFVVRSLIVILQQKIAAEISLCKYCKYWNSEFHPNVKPKKNVTWRVTNETFLNLSRKVNWEASVGSTNIASRTCVSPVEIFGDPIDPDPICCG